MREADRRQATGFERTTGAGPRPRLVLNLTKPPPSFYLGRNGRNVKSAWRSAQRYSLLPPGNSVWPQNPYPDHYLRLRRFGPAGDGHDGLAVQHQLAVDARLALEPDDSPLR